MADGAKSTFARLPHGAVMFAIAKAAGGQIGSLARENGRCAQHKAEVAQQQNRQQSLHSLHCTHIASKTVQVLDSAFELQNSASGCFGIK